MEQQDFWQWEEADGGSAGEGRLDLSELPADLRLEVREAQRLHEGLSHHLGAVNLTLTDNRRRMVSARQQQGRYVLRLHHMFVGCDGATAEALTWLARGEQMEGARSQIKSYIDRNRDEISFDVDPEELHARGESHDLQPFLEKWKKRLDDPTLAGVKVTWGRYGRGRRSIRFGSYDFDQQLIRVHPALDQDWVPPFFVEFIVYHELLHALHPPVEGSSRRIVHTPEFRAMEERFPRYEEAMAWERRHLSRFLER